MKESLLRAALSPFYTITMPVQLIAAAVDKIMEGISPNGHSLYTEDTRSWLRFNRAVAEIFHINAVIPMNAGQLFASAYSPQTNVLLINTKANVNIYTQTKITAHELGHFLEKAKNFALQTVISRSFSHSGDGVFADAVRQASVYLLYYMNQHPGIFNQLVKDQPITKLEQQAKDLSEKAVKQAEQLLNEAEQDCLGQSGLRLFPQVYAQSRGSACSLGDQFLVILQKNRTLPLILTAVRNSWRTPAGESIRWIRNQMPEAEQAVTVSQSQPLQSQLPTVVTSVVTAQSTLVADGNIEALAQLVLADQEFQKLYSGAAPPDTLVTQIRDLITSAIQNLPLQKTNSQPTTDNLQPPECVTGDTLLPILATINPKYQILNPKQVSNSNDQNSKQNSLENCDLDIENYFGFRASCFEFKQIKDIQGGEYVVSLDEATSQFVPRKVVQLLDKGIQPVYRLTTVDGRMIRTTENHPYLVRTGFFEESNVNQNNSNDIQGQHDGTGVQKLINVDIHSFDFLSSNANPVIKQMIAGSRLTVNNSSILPAEIPNKPGEINNTPSQPEARLIDKSAKAEINVAGETNLNIASNVSDKKFVVKPIDGSWLASRSFSSGWTKVIDLHVGDEIAVVSTFFRSKNDQTSQKESSDQKQTVGNSGTGEEILNVHNDLPFSVNQSVANKPTIPSGKFIVNKSLYSKSDTPNIPGETKSRPNQADVKLSQIPENTSKTVLAENSFIENNDSIAFGTMSNDVVFMKIASIEYVGEEQVYDIEVEGTHNFIAGHFVKKNPKSKFLNPKQIQSSDSQNSKQEDLEHLDFENSNLFSASNLDISASNEEYFFGGIVAHNTTKVGNVPVQTEQPPVMRSYQFNLGPALKLYRVGPDYLAKAGEWVKGLFGQQKTGISADSLVTGDTKSPPSDKQNNYNTVSSLPILSIAWVKTQAQNLIAFLQSDKNQRESLIIPAPQHPPTGGTDYLKEVSNNLAYVLSPTNLLRDIDSSLAHIAAIPKEKRTFIDRYEYAALDILRFALRSPLFRLQKHAETEQKFLIVKQSIKTYGLFPTIQWFLFGKPPQPSQPQSDTRIFEFTSGKMPTLVRVGTDYLAKAGEWISNLFGQQKTGISAPIQEEQQIKASSWSDLRMIPRVDRAPKIIDFGLLWNQLFKDTPNFPRASEKAWGFDEDGNGNLILVEEADGLSVTDSTTEVILERPHTLDIHTEPSITKEKLAQMRNKSVGSISESDMFGASMPKNTLADVHRLLQFSQTKAAMTIRMEGDEDLWAVQIAVKTGDYKQLSDWERIGEFGGLGRAVPTRLESLKYNLFFDQRLEKYGVVMYRGFIRFPPSNDGTNYLRKREFSSENTSTYLNQVRNWIVSMWTGITDFLMNRTNR